MWNVQNFQEGHLLIVSQNNNVLIIHGHLTFIALVQLLS